MSWQYRIAYVKVTVYVADESNITAILRDEEHNHISEGGSLKGKGTMIQEQTPLIY